MPGIPGTRDGRMAIDAARGATGVATAVCTFLQKKGVCDLRLHTRVYWCPYCCSYMRSFFATERSANRASNNVATGAPAGCGYCCGYWCGNCSSHLPCEGRVRESRFHRKYVRLQPLQ